MNKLHYFFHISTYYLAWLGGILLAAEDHGGFAFALILIITALEIVWQFRVRKETRGLFRLVFLFTLAGALIDSLFVYFKLIDFNANPFKPYLSPPWMMAIWFNFAVVFYSILGGLFKRYLLLGTISLFAFPLAYLSGVKLGAAFLPLGYFPCLALGIVWAFLFPFCLYLYNSGGSSHA